MASDLIVRRPLSDDARIRSAAAFVQLGRPQDTFDHLGPLVADPRPNVQAVALYLRAQALTLSDQAQEALGDLSKAAQLMDTDDVLQARIALATAEALVAMANEDQAVVYAAKAADALRGRTRLVERMQAIRITTHAKLKLDDIEGARAVLDSGSVSLLGVRWLRQYLDPERERDQEALVYSRGAALLLEQARINVLEALIDLDPRSGGSDVMARTVADDLHECSQLFALLDSPIDRSEVDILLANLLSRSDTKTDRDKALNIVIRALADLDRVRHTLRSQQARAQWSERFNAALLDALALAHLCGDPERTAELIELARVQAIPALRGTLHDEDEVELLSAPTVRVRGEARVIRSGDETDGPVDIETAAAAAAGEGAWWLSYWGTGEGLYWSLVPPDRRPMHGVIECSPGSVLNEVLLSLREALPLEHEGEDTISFQYRLNESPLLVNPMAEAALAHRLGAFLLPFSLRNELTRRWEVGDDPLRLAISPAPELGQVPWASLAVDGPEGPRLVEVATWSLAPSATLLTVTGARRRHEGQCPAALAVLDPTSHTPWVELPAAREISLTIPSAATVLGGRHWDATPATPAAVVAALGRAGRCSTVVFGCHASRGMRDRPSSSALVLAGDTPDDEPALLTAANLLASGITPDRFPAQISLQACDTSDLASASGGEWLSLAPAFLAAGASTVLTTLFPLLEHDADSAPGGLLRDILDGRDLAEAVRAEQLRGLNAWRQHGDGPPASLADAPIVWSSYAPCCTGRAEPGVVRQSPLPVSNRFDALLVDACEVAQTLRDRTITSAHVMTAYVTSVADVLESSFFRAFFGTAGVIVLPKLLRARSSQPEAKYRPSDELLDVVREAAERARQAGSTLEPEHVVNEVLSKERGPGHYFLQAMRLRQLVSFRQEVAYNLREAELGQAYAWQPQLSASAQAFASDVIATIPDVAPTRKVSGESLLDRGGH